MGLRIHFLHSMSNPLDLLLLTPPLLTFILSELLWAILISKTLIRADPVFSVMEFRGNFQNKHNEI